MNTKGYLDKGSVAKYFFKIYKIYINILKIYKILRSAFGFKFLKNPSRN